MKLLKQPTKKNQLKKLRKKHEEIKEEEKEAIPKAKAKATPNQRFVSSATPKKLARSVKVVELVECSACNKKMLPKSLRNTHPHYCKGQPTETLPVNKQKASYGTKVEEKLRKEIEEEMRKKFENNKENIKPNEIIQYSEHEVSCSSATLHEPIEAKTKAKRECSRDYGERPPVVMKPPEIVRQPTASELLQQSYNEMKRLRQQEKQEKINGFKSKMF